MKYPKEFILFLIAGGAAALLNFTSRIFLNYYFEYTVSIVIAYCIGMLTAFFLMKLLVFKVKGNSYYRSGFFFIIINLIAALQTLAISVFLAFYVLPLLNIMHGRLELAHAIGVLIPVITSYYGHKFFTFKT